MGEILEFNPKPPPARDIVLVDHIDVAFCIWAVNMYGIPNDEEMREGYGLVGPEDLPTLQLDFVIECLETARDSDELSDKGKSIISRLLANSRSE
jgi:hypothetical protein